MSSSLDAAALATLFLDARTHNGWTAAPVSDALLRQLYDPVRMGPTSANCSPARFVFVRTPEGKAKLAPALSKGNLDKTMAAPVTAIVARDMQFYEYMPEIWHNPTARDTFANNAPMAQATAVRNATLQGAYLMIAARAIGLDCGPMSGFDVAKVNAEFFPDGRCQTDFLCNLGYGDAAKLHPRGPRLEFREACQML